MSLINDALKRASQVEKNRRPEAPRIEPSQPARAPSRSGGLGLTTLLVAAVVVGLGGGVWLLVRSLTAPPTIAAIAPAPAAPVVAKPMAPASALAPVQKVEPLPATSSSVVAGGSDQPPARALAAAPPPPPAAAPPPPFPDLKLQGIFYSRANPKIAIAGDIYSENDSVGEMQVVKIYPTKVTMAWKGQTKDFFVSGH